MRCHGHPPPRRAGKDDSDEGSGSDWFSGDEAPEETLGDERMLTRDGEAKKSILRVGSGQQRPGKHDLVTVCYSVWQVADDGEVQPVEDPLKWSRQTVVRLEELASAKGETVALGEGLLPVGVEVCARMMRRGERALVRCSGRYGQIASPLFGKQRGKDEGEAPGKLFFRGKLRDAGKLAFLPACPDDQAQFVFRNRRLCTPEARLEMEVELVDLLSVQVLTSDKQVRKAIIRKGVGSRKAAEGNFVACELSDMDPAASLAAAVIGGHGQPRTVRCRLDERWLPHGRGLALVLASMRQGERAIAMLAGKYRFAGGQAEAEDGEETLPEVRLLCTVSSFRRSRQLDAAIRSGPAAAAAAGPPERAPTASDGRFLKEELKRAPDELRVSPREGGAVLVACKRGGGGGDGGSFELLSWCLGSGAVPRLWDEAAESMRLYEYAALQLPRRLLAADGPVAAYEGRAPLRLATCSGSVLEGVRALCRFDPLNGEPAPEVAATLRELVTPGWATCVGSEGAWCPGLGELDAAALRVEGAGSEGEGEPGVSPEFAAETGEGGVVYYHWLLLAVAEALDPSEVEDDEAKQAFVRQHRGLGSALVKEGSFQEASAAYTRALDACRLHCSFKLFFPWEHGEHFRGFSGVAGAQSYAPQLTSKKAPDEADEWVRETAVACRSNLALCALKRREFRECAQHANWVLSAEPKNAKALFRRGTAAAALGEDLMAALRDLEAAGRLQPGDVAVQAEVARVKEQIQATRRAEKAMFQGMLK